MSRQKPPYPRKQFAMMLPRPAVAALRHLNPGLPGTAAEAIVMQFLLSHIDQFPDHLQAHLMAQGARPVGGNLRASVPANGAKRAEMRASNLPYSNPVNYCSTCCGTGLHLTSRGPCLTCNGDGILFHRPADVPKACDIPVHEQINRVDAYIAMFQRDNKPVPLHAQSYKIMLTGGWGVPGDQLSDYDTRRDDPGDPASPSVPPVQDNQDNYTHDHDTGDDDTLTI